MLIGTPQKIKDLTLELFLNEQKIKCIPSTKYLGLYIDNHLTWNDINCQVGTSPP